MEYQYIQIFKNYSDMTNNNFQRGTYRHEFLAPEDIIIAKRERLDQN